ncbi:MAG: hypothetical protein CV089_01420 [Nitrospira sp. WS110]|nr:hypothetical protein [Nitrospira sp. WS110]
MLNQGIFLVHVCPFVVHHEYERNRMDTSYSIVAMKEDTMDKTWLYIGGMLIGVAAIGYLVITFVHNTVPPYTF